VEAESHSVPDSLLSSLLTGMESELKDVVALVPAKRDKEGKISTCLSMMPPPCFRWNP
jgi:hypothetical protein